MSYFSMKIVLMTCTCKEQYTLMSLRQENDNFVFNRCVCWLEMSGNNFVHSVQEVSLAHCYEVPKLSSKYTSATPKILWLQKIPKL